MNLRFACPLCDYPSRAEVNGPTEWQCPTCDHRLTLGAASLEECHGCGNRELYRQKNFPHRLGMSILAAGFLASTVAYYLHHQWLTWAFLIGTSLVDSVLYLFVGDVSVCYRCGAKHSSMKATPKHPPFDLGVGERYRQERLRREELGRAARPRRA